MSCFVFSGTQNLDSINHHCLHILPAEFVSVAAIQRDQHISAIKTIRQFSADVHIYIYSA